MPDETFDIGLAREYAVLARQKGELTTQLEDVERKMKRLKPRLLKEFERTGVPRIPIAGMTVYLQRDLRARVPEGSSKRDACEALKAAGYGDYVEEAFNHNSVSALFRSLDREDEEIPEELKGKIEPVEVFDVRTRKK